jgi:hypothetical protein
MEIGQILAILLVLGYVSLYLRGRYYQRENFDDDDDDSEPFTDDDDVDVIGSGR